MNDSNHKLIQVAYELFALEDGKEELVEQASAEQPFQFISGMDVALDAFEERVVPMAKGETFDFTLPPAEAYGDYDPMHVLSLDKQMFCIDGHFDKDNIFPGNVIPLINQDGNRFNGTVLEVLSDKVVVDLNHPLAGKTLHFKGSVVESRPATDEEIEGQVARMSQDHCDCCDGEGHGDCCHHGEGHGDCGHHHHDGGGCCHHKHS